MSNYRVSETKGFIRRAANVALSCVLAASLTPTPALAQTVSRSSGSDMLVAAQQAESIDITAQWNAGGMAITQGGRYVLSSDVHSTGSLVIAAPEGQTVTLDFCGHVAEVRGAVESAVVVDDTQGAVVLCDSSFDDQVSFGQREADSEPLAGIRLVSTDGTASVAAVRFNASEDGKGATRALSLSHLFVQSALASVADGIGEQAKLDAYGVYAGFSYETDEDALSVSFDGCSVESVVANESVAQGETAAWVSAAGAHVDTSHAGIAAGIFASVKGVALSGALRSSAASDGGSADLYSTASSAFSLKDGFASACALRVFSDGNAQGGVFATCESADEASRLASSFADATGALSVSSSGANLVFAAASSADPQTSVASVQESHDAALASDTSSASVADVPVGTRTNPKAHAANLLLLNIVEGSPLRSAEWVCDLAQASTDLNALWSNTSRSLSISSSGTYFLSSDLHVTSEASLLFTGEGVSATLQLNGHKIVFETEASSGYAVSVANGASLKIDGGSSSSKGTIECIGSTTYDAVRMDSTGSLKMTNANVIVRPSVEHGNASSLNMRAVDVNSVNGGAVEIDSCTLTVDQTNITTNKIELPATHPAGVYIANDKRAESLSISNTAINVTASPSTIMGNTDDIADAKFTGAGYQAYGIYAASARTSTTVEGCTVRVCSVNGMAVGLYGASATVSGAGLSVTASSRYVAAAVQSAGSGAVSLNGPVSLSVDSTSSPRRKALLYATDERAFVLAEGFKATSATVLCRVDGEENLSGWVALQYGFTPTSAKLSEYTSLFKNALGDDASCTMQATSDGVCFAIDAQNAKASVIHANGSQTAYSSVNQALAAATNGETVRLAGDAGDVAFSGGTRGSSVTLDLAGHEVNSITNAGASNLSVVSTGSRGRVAGTASVNVAGTTTEAAIVQSGSGALSLSNLTVKVSSGMNPIDGVLVTRGSSSSVGSVSCDGVSVTVSSSSKAVSGVSVQGGTGSPSVTFTGGSIVALQTAPSSNAYGIENANANATVSLQSCPVSAETIAGTPTAVMTSGSFSASADASCKQVISAIADGEALSASGVIASSGAKVSLNNVDVTVQIAAAGDDLDAYCLRSTGNAGGADQWTIDGGCSFTSSSSKTILLRGTSLTLGASFRNAGESSIFVRSENLSGDTFARVSSGSTARADEIASWFSPVAGTSYDGWRCKATTADGGSASLSWFHDAVVRNESTGRNYASLAAALSDAASGARLSLVGDGIFYGAQAISQSGLTIDLAGHSLTISAEGAAAAVDFTGTGTLSVVDSAEEKGCLTMKVGSSKESTNRAAQESNAYAGINVASGTLNISGAKVEAVYTGGGASNNAQDIDVVTCFAKAGSVYLGDSAAVSVQGSASSEGAGATRAYAVYASSSCSGTISVSSSAAVSAANASALIQAGEVRDGNIDSDFEEGYQALRRLKLSTDSSLYQEILQKFRAQAKLDDSSSGGDDGFGARVYYVERMSLDNGMLIWAVSNQVKVGEELQKNIVPAAIFTQSYYSIAPQAVGVGAASASAAKVSVSGAVRAESQSGDAYGVFAAGTGSWTVDGARISSQGGSKSYEGVSAAKINLSNYLQFEKAPSDSQKNWFYPSSADPHEIVACRPIAAGVAAADKTSLTVDGATTLAVEGALPESIQATCVTFGASFGPSSDQKLTVGSPSGANTTGTAFALAASGASISASWFADAYGKLSPVKQANGSVAWDGPYTVTFHSEEGVAARYENLLAGQTVKLPDPETMHKYGGPMTTYEFLGWSTDKNATTPQIASDAGSVSVTRSADYYPVYRAVAKAVNVTFSNLREADGSLRAATSSTVGYGKTFAECVGAVVPTQGDYVKNGMTYRFIGWRDPSGTIWDTRSFATDVAFDYATIAQSANGAVSLSAAFVPVDAGEHLVSFRADASVVAYAVKDGSEPSYYDACGGKAVAPQKLAVQAGYLYAFAGWHKGYIGGTSVGVGSVDFSSTESLPKVSEDVTYTACFSSAKRQAFVKFSYWHQQDDGTWTNGLSPLISVEYGSDPIAEANKLVKVGDQVNVNGSTYTFLGWSPRKSDLDALYTDSLPACTNTTSTDDRLVYYGIYRQEELTLDVVFHDGSDVYATANQCSGTDTVNTAFVSTGASTPAAKDGKSFLGWATTPDATSVDAPGSSTLASVCTSGSGTLDLYAVYGDAFRPTLTFVTEDGSVLGVVTVEAGASLLSNTDIPTPPAKEGSFFQGWSFPDGSLLDLAKGVTSTTRLTATYQGIVTNAVEGDAESGVTGSVDVSRASLVRNDVMGATRVVFNLNNVASVDPNLTAQAKVNGDKIISDAVYYGAYLADGNRLTVVPDAGKVVLKLSVGAVGENSRVRVYWTDGDGSVKYSSAYDSADGMVSVVLSGYSALSEKGNIAVAEVGADSGALNGASGGSLSKASGSLQDASLAGGSLSKSASASSPAGTASASVEAADAVGASDVGAYDGPDLLRDETDASLALSDIAGNPVTWAIVVLMMGAVGAVAWYALIGRRRGVAAAEAGEADDEAGWSDEAEEPKASPAREMAGSASAGDSNDASGGIKF